MYLLATMEDHREINVLNNKIQNNSKLVIEERINLHYMRCSMANKFMEIKKLVCVREKQRHSENPNFCSIRPIHKIRKP
mgnify:CR=1 FL=1